MRRELLLLVLWVAGCSSAVRLDDDDAGPVADADGSDSDPGAPLPRRVLFLVDTADSMSVADPEDAATGEPRRVHGLRLAIEALLGDERYETAIGVVGFSSWANALTFDDANGNGVSDHDEGLFTDDLDALVGHDGTAGVVAMLEGTNPGTASYLNAFELAHSAILEELGRVDASRLEELQLSVIIVGDFILEDDLVEAEAVIEETRSALADVASAGVGGLEVDCAHLEYGSAAIDRQAQDIARDIAEAGGGQARSFGRGEAIDLLFTDD